MKKFFIYAIILGVFGYALADAALPAVAGQTLRIEAALEAAGV